MVEMANFMCIFTIIKIGEILKISKLEQKTYGECNYLISIINNSDTEIC